MREAWATLPEGSSRPLLATLAQSRNLAHASLETAVDGILYHLGCRASTRGSACTKGRAGTTYQFCTSDGLIGVWCKHYLWCHPSGLIDLNEPLGSCTTWFMLHFFGACSKKDWYRIESGACAWPKTMVQNSTYHRDCHDITSGIRTYYTTRHTLDMCTLICHSLTMNP